MPRGRPKAAQKTIPAHASQHMSEQAANEPPSAPNPDKVTEDQSVPIQDEKPKVVRDKKGKIIRTPSEKARMAEEKLARQEYFKKMSKEQRDYVAGLEGEERKAYFKAMAERRKNKKKRIQSGLIFPVLRLRKKIKKTVGKNYGTFKGMSSKHGFGLQVPIFVAAVMEYMVAEVVELAGNCALEHKRSRIIPRHIMQAIRSDDEIDKIMTRNTIYAGSGVLQKEVPAFLQKNNVPRKHWNDHFRLPEKQKKTKKVVKKHKEMI